MSGYEWLSQSSKLLPCWTVNLGSEAVPEEWCTCILKGF